MIECFNCCPDIEKVKLFAQTKSQLGKVKEEKDSDKCARFHMPIFAPFFCRMVISWICSICGQFPVRRMKALLSNSGPSQGKLGPRQQFHPNNA